MSHQSLRAAWASPSRMRMSVSTASTDAPMVPAAAEWLVAVGAGHALGVHAALREGTPVVDLIPHLPVIPVETLLQQAQAVGVEGRFAVHVVVGDAGSAGVAAGAGVEFATGGAGAAAVRGGAPGRRCPGHD